MNVIFSNVKEIDAQAVCRFMNRFATWKVHPHVDQWSRMIANSAAVISAWEDGVLVGFARGISDEVRYAQVLDVLVHPEYRGQGIGKSLIKRLVNEPVMQVRAVILGTPDKLEFYESAGFKCVNDRAYFMVMVRDEFGVGLLQPIEG